MVDEDPIVPTGQELTDLIEADIAKKLNPDFLEYVNTVTVDDSGLDLTVNVSDLISNSQYTVVADATETKYILCGLCRNADTAAYNIFYLTKTTGEYGELPSDEQHVMYFKEFSCAAQGTSLTEVESWL